MLKAQMESDHICLYEEFGVPLIKISGVDSYNDFVDSSYEGPIMCMSSMDFPFESTVDMNLIALANQFTGNTITTPDHYYQPLPHIRDENGIGEFCYWIMQENGMKDFPNILEENWCCYDEDELGSGVTVVLVDAIPQTLELRPA